MNIHLKYFCFILLVLCFVACKHDYELPMKIDPVDPVDTMDVNIDELDPWPFIPLDTTYGRVKIAINDTALWVGEAYVKEKFVAGSSKTKIVIIFNTYEPQFGFRRELFGITEIPKGWVGDFEFDPLNTSYDNNLLDASFFTLKADGDVAGENYLVDTSFESNKLTFEEADTINNYYSGTFDLRFERMSDGSLPPFLGDTITFRHGEFWFRLQE